MANTTKKTATNPGTVESFTDTLIKSAQKRVKAEKPLPPPQLVQPAAVAPLSEDDLKSLELLDRQLNKEFNPIPELKANHSEKVMHLFRLIKSLPDDEIEILNNRLQVIAAITSKEYSLYDVPDKLKYGIVASKILTHFKIIDK